MGLGCHNPAIAKFLSFDLLAPEYPELTPYQFAGNTPIMATDLDGLEAIVVIWVAKLGIFWPCSISNSRMESRGWRA